MAEAHYFHATLYRFITPKSRAEVVTRFNSAIRDVSARCWYIVDNDVFELICPQAVGFAADECLGAIIDKYIEDELQAAEREDRPPQVEQFHNNFLDDLPPDLDNADAFEPPSAPPPPPPQLVSEVRTAFVIDLEGHQPTHVRLLQSRDMPSEVVGRTLVDLSNRKNARTFGRGHRVCAVRWDVTKSEYVFNGSRGHQMTVPAAVEESYGLALDFWPVLQGTPARDRPIDAAVTAEDDNLRRWNFKGQKPTVSQWLSGIGETEPEERPDESELPHDARRMLASANSTFDTVPRGRIRVAQGASLLPSLPEDEDDNSYTSDSDSEGEPVDFSQLLGSVEPQRQLVRSLSSRSESDVDTHSEHVSFNDLLAINSSSVKTNRDLGVSPHQISRLGIPTQEASVQNDVTQIQSVGTTRENESVNGGSGFVMRGTELMATSSSSAIIDSMGLKGHATIQAKWNLDHHGEDRQQLRSRKTASTNGLRLRSRMPNLNGGGSASVTDISNFTREGLPQQVNAKKWITVMAPRADPTSADLVDTRFEPSIQTTKLPPRLPDIDPESNVQLLQDVLHTGPANEGPTINDQLLIDLDGLDPPLARPVESKLSFHSESLTPTRRCKARATGENVVERLAEQNEPPLLRYTMRQKARKKKKSQPVPKDSQSQGRLSLPDPILPLEGKGNAKLASALPQTGPNDKQEARPDKPSRPVDVGPSIPIGAANSIDLLEVHKLPLAGPDAAESKVTQLEEFLSAVQPLLARDNSQIVVQFGKTYLEFPGGKPSSSTDPTMLTEDLKSDSSLPQTAFFNRLTQCHLDALQVLKLAPGQLRAGPNTSYYYDIHVRSTEGKLHVLRSRLHGDMDDTMSPDSPAEIVRIADAYVLFPFRSFDAHVSAETFSTGKDSIKSDCQEFLRSARSFAISPDPVIADPSFQAHAPSRLRIDKIYARTCFTVHSAHNSRLQVSRIRELKIEPTIDSGQGYNMKATMNTEDLTAVWWEAQLCFDPDIRAADLLPLVESIVKGMDGVGFENQGPWVIESPTELSLKGQEKDRAVRFW